MGRYRLLEPIGRGGMSTVYAGEHVTLRRPVAIKVLHDHLVGEGVMGRRMIDEAHTIAALHHPGIVEVLDVGTTSDGRTFVVMERLQGEPLSERLRGGRLPEERAIAFARQLASALEVAHAAGVVHRDLKPENVFIVDDPDVPGGERVKVLDFGIAKRDIDGRERTLTGVVLGTPAYMAPEQTVGGAVDGRADVYALGVVLYLMVTGALPFQGANTDELMVEHAFCAPAPAAARAPVSRRLSAIIERCLAKRPADRYDSMAVLAATLDGLDGGPRVDAFDDENTDVEDESAGPVRNAARDAKPRREVKHGAPPRREVSTDEATGRMLRPPTGADRTEPFPRPSGWSWVLAACAAVALGLGIAVVVRETRAPARPVPAGAVLNPAPASDPAPVIATVRSNSTAAAAVAPPPARPRTERRVEKKPERPRPREVARRAATVTKEEAFARVEPPTLY